MSQKAQSASAGGSKKVKRRKVIDSWKAKNWYEVYAPKSFKESFIGRVPSADEESLKSRTIETLLYDFTNDFKHTHIKLQFKIATINGQRCEALFYGHELTRDFVRALIHRGSSRIDGIFNYKTADGFVYRVSAFVVTRRRAKGSQKNTIRKIIYQVVNEFAKSSKHGKFVRGMIYGKYAENIAKIVKTIYPLKECQIRKCKLVSVPEGIVEDDYEEDEVFEEKSITLRTHGKTIRAKKKQRKAGQKSEGAEGEGAELAEDADNAPEDAGEGEDSNEPETEKTE